MKVVELIGFVTAVYGLIAIGGRLGSGPPGVIAGGIGLVTFGVSLMMRRQPVVCPGSST
jgi:hypothetical protein